MGVSEILNILFGAGGGITVATMVAKLIYDRMKLHSENKLTATKQQSEIKLSEEKAKVTEWQMLFGEQHKCLQEEREQRRIILEENRLLREELSKRDSGPADRR